MSLKKFGRSDIIRNAMRAYPHSNFLIYSSSVYYDQRPIESGSFSDDILSVLVELVYLNTMLIGAEVQY